MKYIVLMLMIFSSGCECKDDPSVKVVSVGGCDAYGKCGVKYSDGSYDTEYYPTVGQSKKVCD